MKSTLITIAAGIVVVAAFYIGKHFYLKPKNITGEKAPELTGTLIDGRTFKLSQLSGQYVLIGASQPGGTL
jgi:hypothetical protein